MRKSDIDQQAEREGIALRKQGAYRTKNRVKKQWKDYNRIRFEKLFTVK